MFGKFARKSFIIAALSVAIMIISGRALGSAAYSNAQVRDKLHDILMRPEFLQSRFSTGWSEGLRDFLIRIFSGGVTAGGGVNLLLIALTLVAIGFGIFFFSTRLARIFSPSKAKVQTEPVEMEVIDENKLRAEADKFMGAGSYREAIRYLYLSLLLNLDKKQLISFDLAKTNREYLQELKKKSASFDAFSRLVSLFERKWYGLENCSADDYKQFEAIYGSLVREG